MSETETNQSSPTEVDISLKFAKKTLQDYEVVSVIGNGSFGTCFKVRDKQTGEVFAWKGMDYDELSDAQKKSLVSEIRVLRQLQHPNIVQYYHHLVNHEAKSIFIVMECCEGGDLAHLIAEARAKHKRFEERYIWRLLFQICRALQVCHNKIKQGTILHRDIKPANIFLDREGNAKLGDFGLARMLRRNECFAETFVGTPYYMSPELVKGSRYDRKSDVWAVGCLIYEMCALRPPFKGREFNQLSANITIGKFNNIPDVYSKDLQEIIAFMLEVEDKQRPSIEVISRHPIVVRNISELGNEFPRLVDIEAELLDFYVVPSKTAGVRQLAYSPPRDFSSTLYSRQHSFDDEGYGQRRASVSGVFTPDLRAELFYSAERRVYGPTTSKIQLSDPELYESIRRDEYASINDTIKLKEPQQLQSSAESPALVTQAVFERALQERLHAIRAQECRLQQREQSLDEREQQLNEKEKRLQALEQSLHERSKSLPNENGRKALPAPAPAPSRRPTSPPPPPIPPRKPIRHDESYCTIEASETTLLHEPTMAKLDLAALAAPKALPTLRRVTFQSPKKFITYDIENVPPKQPSSAANNNCRMQTSTSSKGSEESGDSNGTANTLPHRRKSILSIFGLNRSSKDATNTKSTTTKPSLGTTTNSTNQVKEQSAFVKKEQILQSRWRWETAELGNMWTKEHKRAAFDLLAAMNAAERGADAPSKAGSIVRHKLRQSVRERNTLHRNRLRRSLIAPTTVGHNCKQRDQMVL